VKLQAIFTKINFLLFFSYFSKRFLDETLFLKEMINKCDTGALLDCPCYSVCEYDPNKRLIVNIDPLNRDGSWEYETRNYFCQSAEIQFENLLKND
jgi:hypothetical protein